MRIKRRKNGTMGRFSDKEMIRLLKMKARELGRAPGIAEVDSDKRLPNSTTYRAHFGSYFNTLKKANIRSTHVVKYDCTQIIRLLRKKAKELGKAPERREVDADPTMPGSSVYRRCFGSFKNAVRKTGYSIKGEYSNKEMLRLFKKKARELGRSPYVSEIAADKKLPSPSFYYTRFGSIRNIQKILGLTPNVFRCSDEELLTMLKNKAEESGRPPTTRDLKEDRNLPSATAYRGHFGSFERAKKLAGCPSSFVFRRYTRAKLLKLLRKKIKVLGRMPFRREVDADKGMPFSTTYDRRFGGWQNLRRMMGYPTRKKHKKKDRYLTKTGEYNIPKILSYFRKRSNRLGRFPLSEELRKDPNIPDLGTLRKIFGSMQELARLINVTPPKKDYKFRSISRDQFKNEIIRFYRKYRKLPRCRDFFDSREFPPQTLLQKEKITWNQFLHNCGFPIHSRGGSPNINRRAELIVKEVLLASNHKVEDLTVISYLSPYSFRVDKKVRIHVSGSTWQQMGRKYKYMGWLFTVPSKKTFDYMVGVGMDKKKRAKAIYVFPVDVLSSLRVHATVYRKNRYSRFRLDDFNQLNVALGILKRKKK